MALLVVLLQRDSEKLVVFFLPSSVDRLPYFFVTTIYFVFFEKKLLVDGELDVVVGLHDGRDGSVGHGSRHAVDGGLSLILFVGGGGDTIFFFGACESVSEVCEKPSCDSIFCGLERAAEVEAGRML